MSENEVQFTGETVQEASQLIFGKVCQGELLSPLIDSSDVEICLRELYDAPERAVQAVVDKVAAMLEREAHLQWADWYYDRVKG